MAYTLQQPLESREADSALAVYSPSKAPAWASSLHLASTSTLRSEGCGSASLAHLQLASFEAAEARLQQVRSWALSLYPSPREEEESAREATTPPPLPPLRAPKEYLPVKRLYDVDLEADYFPTPRISKMDSPAHHLPTVTSALGVPKHLASPRRRRPAHAGGAQQAGGQAVPGAPVRNFDAMAGGLFSRDAVLDPMAQRRGVYEAQVRKKLSQS
eukprot:TRINITY_DN70281_c0_g1_i1.p1 TRINITY_DN70281_c0_g1~~TRINITY_DN70281_c0_g1_i1.p1  ORF type:complete len:215 (+),score=52.16 TRINITY_DN70281_c0_g1_i1:59-703(+)